MDKQKENAFDDFINMIHNSWTYGRMTADEKDRFDYIISHSLPIMNAIQGTYKQRWNALQAVYTSYLYGLGYDNFNWREPETGEPVPKF